MSLWCAHAIVGELYSHYYDQAHFTNEFRKMTGHSPRKFTDHDSV